MTYTPRFQVWAWGPWYEVRDTANDDFVVYRTTFGKAARDRAGYLNGLHETASKALAKWSASLLPDAPDEVPMPEVVSGCFVCGVTIGDVDDRSVVISPSGKAHFGEDHGVTRCGKDATGDNWWWPL